MTVNDTRRFLVLMESWYDAVRRADLETMRGLLELFERFGESAEFIRRKRNVYDALMLEREIAAHDARDAHR